MVKSSNPIGIFDSGIGGLTVARALVDILPQENIIYFGDTAHFPYGDKSQEAIQNYSLQIANLLLEKKCKLILIACGTASSVAYPLLKKHLAGKALLVNVIDPVISFLGNNYCEKRIGLIATRLTVDSNVYGEKIKALKNAKISFFSRATPLIVAAIEEGFYETNVIEELLELYLHDFGTNDTPIDGLILACTHFPLIKEKVSAFYKGKVDIIDPSQIVARYVKDFLVANHLTNKNRKKIQSFYISDYTNSFAKSAKKFFGCDISIAKYHL